MVVNDITQITVPNSFEWSFQFSQNLSQQKVTTLDKLHEGLQNNVTVKCKVLKFGTTKGEGQAKYHVLNATIADVTGQIVLNAWSDIIPKTPRKQSLLVHKAESTILEWNEKAHHHNQLSDF